MIKIDLILDYLRRNLTPRRLKHSISVATVARDLAKKYGVDEDKAYIAGLVHDCAKELKLEQMKTLADEENIKVEYQFQNKSILHGVAAISICRNQFEIIDDDILNAVRYHTTGRANMTMLEKIIFVADYIEPSRSFEEVDYVRKVLETGLDYAVILVLKNTMKHIKDKNNIEYNTILAYNYLIEEKNNE